MVNLALHQRSQALFSQIILRHHSQRLFEKSVSLTSILSQALPAKRLGEEGRFFAVSGSFSLWEKAGMRAKKRKKT
jgi:hypothetical protein